MATARPHPIGALSSPHIPHWPNFSLEANQSPPIHRGPIGAHLVSLKHLENGDVSYCVHQTPWEFAARDALLDFLNVGISLTELWTVFSAKDSRFAEFARYLGGARVLTQDLLECLVQFLCSSNNNIGRITKMVDFVWTHLGSVGGFEFHELFPSLERLSMVSEQELREAGFGYRFISSPMPSPILRLLQISFRYRS